MKKRISVFGLGLRLTALASLAVIALTCVLQGWLFWRQESVWSAVPYEYGYTIGVAQIIQNDGISSVGIGGVVVLLAVMAGCTFRAQTGMTIRRLRISEWEVTAWWSVLFAGYLALYWVAQLGILLWMHWCFGRVYNWGTLDLFLSAYTCPYFHLILPLGEPWAVVRNVCFCLGGGILAAVSAMECRHGGKPVMLFVTYYLARVFLPNDMASLDSDLAALGVLACVMAGYLWKVIGGMKGED